MSAPVIESLFPEFSNQGGDNGNMMYLKASLPAAEFVETRFTDEPAFLSRDVDFIYLGYMTEAEQEKVAAKLMSCKDRLAELVERGCVVLFTGNACDLLGTKIVSENGREIDCLGFFDFVVKQDFSRRIVEPYLGTFVSDEVDAQPLEIVGYKVQFTQVEGDNSREPFCKNEVGFGLKYGDFYEGYRRRNLFGTWLCAPLLPMNPLFTEYLMRLMGETGDAAFRAEALAAYQHRLEEQKTPGLHMPI